MALWDRNDLLARCQRDSGVPTTTAFPTNTDWLRAWRVMTLPLASEALPVFSTVAENRISGSERMAVLAMGLPLFRESPFFRRIPHIVVPSPDEQMVRSNTRPNVAMVTDVEVNGNRSKVQLPRRTMGSQESSRGSIMKASVATLFRSRPQPTGIRFLNVRPESFYEWFGLRTIGHNNQFN